MAHRNQSTFVKRWKQRLAQIANIPREFSYLALVNRLYWYYSKAIISLFFASLIIMPTKNIRTRRNRKRKRGLSARVSCGWATDSYRYPLILSSIFLPDFINGVRDPWLTSFYTVIAHWLSGRDVPRCCSGAQVYLIPASFLSLIEDFSSAVYLLIFYLIKLLGSCFGHRWLSFAVFQYRTFFLSFCSLNWR